MKLLVTGGAGFIGSNFILYWMDQHPGDTLLNVDKLTYAGNLENLESIRNNPHYQFAKFDICDKANIEPLLDGVELIVHFAAESHVDRSIMDSDIFVQTNIVGTHTLLEIALKNKIRFHHISTDEVFGSLELGSLKKFNETTNYDPHSPYSASKAASDHLVRAFYHTYNLPVTITNCTNNFGPFQFPEKFIPLVITNILQGKKIPVYGDGLNERDWLYVTDHCRAIDAVITKGKIGETYCIGGMNSAISNMDVVKQIIKIMGKSMDIITYVKDRPGHDRRYAIDWQKINCELGWKPQYDFTQYLESTVKWYVDHRSWWERIIDGKYKQYYQKQYGGMI